MIKIWGWALFANYWVTQSVSITADATSPIIVEPEWDGFFFVTGNADCHSECENMINLSKADLLQCAEQVSPECPFATTYLLHGEDMNRSHTCIADGSVGRALRIDLLPLMDQDLASFVEFFDEPTADFIVLVPFPTGSNGVNCIFYRPSVAPDPLKECGIGPDTPVSNLEPFTLLVSIWCLRTSQSVALPERT
eukprot:Gregarina_sp_Poly_1__7517@NODE_4199_length_690_cov_141_788122_g2675_i1_p1_GENE_NODE_4199_length_690_cov_141_788122_g2675_i1NODE_4199_length_690_cov_141_788122_g2675_i1_p1_ORF_typecomplete_len194_score15_54_NODE_4199_length_690_cov_141_788122_g2675_i15586